jgi:anti-sigma factor RsiW
VNQNVDCERARLELMAALDGETPGRTADAPAQAKQHLASCAACERWLRDFESMNQRFQGVAYESARQDLWPALEPRLRRSATPVPVMPRLWVLGALVLGWRALQLLVDLPHPFLLSLVPLAAVVAALWLLARDPLAIETFAPELQKRGA